MTTLLTYPADVKYPTSGTTFRDMVVSPNSSSGLGIPTRDTISSSTGAQGDWHNYNGGYTGGTVYDIYSRKSITSSYAAFQFKAETSTNGLQIAKFLDVGDGALRSSGSSFSSSYQSSYMENVTSCWGLLNSYGTQDRNSCHVMLDKVGLRLKNYNNNTIIIVDCTQKLGTYTLGNGRYANDGPVVFGYGVSSSTLNRYSTYGYRFLGFRLQCRLHRKGSGTKTDNLRLGISALTPGFGNYNNSWNSNAKRIICRRRTTSFSSINSTYYIETV